VSYLRLINMVYFYCMGCAYDKSTASVSCKSNLQLTECDCHGFVISTSHTTTFYHVHETSERSLFYGGIES